MGNGTLWLLHGRELRLSTISFAIQYTDLKINFIKDCFIECKWFGIHTCHNALVAVQGLFSGLGSLLPWVQGTKQGPSLLCVSGVFNTEPSFLSRLDMWLDMFLLKEHVFYLLLFLCRNVYPGLCCNSLLHPVVILWIQHFFFLFCQWPNRSEVNLEKGNVLIIIKLLI